jgi:hypothetical protein
VRRIVFLLVAVAAGGCHLLLGYSSETRDHGVQRERSTTEGSKPMADGPDTGPGHDGRGYEGWGDEGLPYCSDGTQVGACSSTKPLSCDSTRKLVSDCAKCGCPVVTGPAPSNSCVSGWCELKIWPDADTYVLDEASCSKHGGEEVLKVGKTSEALINFTVLPMFPLTQHYTVTIRASSALRLNVVGWDSKSLSTVSTLVADPWNETVSICYNTRPQSLSFWAGEGASLTFGENVYGAKALLDSWLGASAVAYGIKLAPVPQATQTVLSIASRSYTDSSKRPVLEIHYK